MEWNEIINNPSLRDLPFKIETNEWGQIVMSAAINKHSVLHSEILVLLREFEGKSFNECSIETSKGVKVADVVWCSTHFLQRNGFETPYKEAPEICVEVVSPSNLKREMSEKKRLYFERGAYEVWICHEKGIINFYNSKGEIEKSEVFPQFPKEIEVSWQ